MLRIIFVIPTFVALTAALAAALGVMALLRLNGRGKISILYSRAVCALLGVRIRIVGAPPQHHAVLVLANHVSWVDILAITATVPVIFVAKSEVKRWPLIGWVARVRGTVFVERERRRQTAAAVVDIARHLADGQSIILFAEGTSSDGNRVLPFRPALVGALREALGQAGAGKRIAVQPLSIGYTGLLGLPMGRQHRPIVAWYGDRDLVSHLREFLRRGAVDVTLSWGEPVEYGDGADRKSVVRSLEAVVRSLTAAALRGRPIEIPAAGEAPRAAVAEPDMASVARVS
ncbi:MAG: 1-acyl-sn-glycerol-3-phosphate acyltransferase [Rhizobiales bacterium]|nr:1-acyl-sn-glycerol-3-phosphate acyltransferase [Hyphomicrobiales bacterium]